MGQGIWFISAIFRDTETPEYRERPPRLQLTNAERGNPAVVRKTGTPSRKGSRTPQRAQDVPRSECQRPKGIGKPTATPSDNLLDRHRSPRHEG
jgi:hypothetical protein